MAGVRSMTLVHRRVMSLLVRSPRDLRQVLALRLLLLAVVGRRGCGLLGVGDGHSVLALREPLLECLAHVGPLTVRVHAHLIGLLIFLDALGSLP